MNVSINAQMSWVPRITADASNRIYLVWYGDYGNSGNHQIFFSSSNDGGASFSTPINLSNDVGPSFGPQIALDLKGKIDVVWEDDSAGFGQVLFSRSNDGGFTFSTPVNLSLTQKFAGSPEIALDSNGDINVVWASPIFFTRSTELATNFSTPLNLSNDLGPTQLPQIVIDSNHHIHVVWNDSSSNRSQVLFATSRRPVLTVPRNTLSFNSERIGVHSPPKKVNITSSALNVVTVNFTAITTTGDFAQTNNCPQRMEPGTSCTITLVFTPTALGKRTGTLTITDNATGSPQTVPLVGFGIM